MNNQRIIKNTILNIYCIKIKIQEINSILFNLLYSCGLPSSIVKVAKIENLTKLVFTLNSKLLIIKVFLDFCFFYGRWGSGCRNLFCRESKYKKPQLFHNNSFTLLFGIRMPLFDIWVF